MAPRTVNIHATCVLLESAAAAFGASRAAGVLLLGKSGAGKSDLALQLIALGAKLVSDDRTELFVERGKLFARAPQSIAGLIEVARRRHRRPAPCRKGAHSPCSFAGAPHIKASPTGDATRPPLTCPPPCL